MTRVLVTGGAGFIGSAVCRLLVGELGVTVLNLDKLTYAANVASVRPIQGNSRYLFCEVDISHLSRVSTAFQEFDPDAVLHLAAESHVDRSIDRPAEFIKTNIDGTHTLLAAALDHWRRLPPHRAARFRFHHVSTDEVFGSGRRTGKFTEISRYKPSSPYSASKAAADHLVRAWHLTYGLPIVISTSSNNYGPYQFPEKLIPLAILKAVHGEAIPVYGDGQNIRDWLYVEDHARALYTILTEGRVGHSYNVGGRAEYRNLEVVKSICRLLDEMLPSAGVAPHENLITFVADRRAHDRRYSMDTTKLRNRLLWEPRENFESGLRKTVAWYLNNLWWWWPIWSQNYRGERLGQSRADFRKRPAWRD